MSVQQHTIRITLLLSVLYCLGAAEVIVTMFLQPDMFILIFVPDIDQCLYDLMSQKIALNKSVLPHPFFFFFLKVARVVL